VSWECGADLKVGVGVDGAGGPLFWIVNLMGKKTKGKHSGYSQIATH